MKPLAKACMITAASGSVRIADNGKGGLGLHENIDAMYSVGNVIT